MTEKDFEVETGSELATVESLQADFVRLGVQPGMTLLAHASFRKLGAVCGGPVASILALENILGAEGTLVMPTHTGGLSEPSHWTNPPVPKSWWPIIRQQVPAFDIDLTPTRQMGVLAETFRKQKGVQRSNHPQVSFAAWGKNTAFITENHDLIQSLGENSPLARLYDLNAWVMLLGVGHGNNTSLHLAEYRANYPGKYNIVTGAPIFLKGKREWVEFEDLNWDDSDFEELGTDFSRETGLEKSGLIAEATALFFPQRALIDYAVGWLEKHRG